MNLEHYSEQMEAARRDFNKLWETKLEQRAFNLGIRDIPMMNTARDLTWQAFLHAIQIKYPVDNGGA